MALQLQDVGLAVKRLQWKHHREANRRLATIGLSLVQWDVLRHLHQHPDASLHMLAQLTFQTDQSMGTLATRMIARGLLRRQEGPGRAVRHEVTEAGETARVKGGALLDEVLVATIGRLSESEQGVLYELLTRAGGTD